MVLYYMINLSKFKKLFKIYRNKTNFYSSERNVRKVCKSIVAAFFGFFFLAKKLDTKNQNPINHKQDLELVYSNILGFRIF